MRYAQPHFGPLGHSAVPSLASIATGVEALVPIGGRVGLRPSIRATSSFRRAASGLSEWRYLRMPAGADPLA